MKQSFCLLLSVFLFTVSSSAQVQTGYLLEHENDISRDNSAPHNGKGTTTAYSFFTGAVNSHLVFRKRALHAGASIGYHLQKAEEIYYVVSGTGEMKVNNEIFKVKPGDAILTLQGNSHGLQQQAAMILLSSSVIKEKNDECFLHFLFCIPR